MKWRTSTVALALTALTLSAWLTAGPQIRKVDDSALKHAGDTGTEWLTYGLTQAETRFSPLNQINAGNVKRLGLAWSHDAGSGGGGQEATPLVSNGTLYAITNWSVVFAVDARTGKERWRWDPEVNQTAVRPKVCCGVVNRGLAIYQGMIFAPVIDGRLLALDAETGKVLWEARVAYPQDQYTITMAPRIAKGKVIIGASGGDRPTRGFFDAYDAATGRRAWRFYTIPGDPSKPFENAAMRKAAETWDGEWWKLGGGGSVWDGMAYDPDAELIYVGTGNAEPWAQVFRTATRKDNLYVCSILAVHVETGELKWHYQVVPGDIWDFDSVQHLMLADLTINGRPRKVIMQANKNAFFYVIDRITGTVHLGAAFLQGHVGQGHRSEDRAPDRESGSLLRHRADRHLARRRRRAQLDADVVQSGGGTGVHPYLHEQQLRLRRRANVLAAAGPDDRHRATGADRDTAPATGHRPRAYRRTGRTRSAGGVGSGRSADALAHARRRRHWWGNALDRGKSGLPDGQRWTASGLQC